MTDTERLKLIAVQLNGVANAMASAIVVSPVQMAYWREQIERAYDIARSSPQDSLSTKGE